MTPKHRITVELDDAGLAAYKILNRAHNMGPLISALLERQRICHERWKRQPAKPMQTARTAVQ